MKKIIFTFLSIAIALFANGQALIDVTASPNVFTPANITINVGDTVRWTNVGGFHNVNANESTAANANNPESFGNNVGSGWVFTHVFSNAGFYNYQCDPHVGLGMTGTVTVIGIPDVTNDDWITTGANTTTLNNVAIGTATPATGYSLSVVGSVICEVLQVLPGGSWPDYVFNKEYDLWSLEAVENFIDINNRLPGVPSAECVESDGISIGEMSKVLMEKVEELTLHMIEQSKQLNEQSKQLNEQSDQIKNLQNENIELRKIVKQ